MGCWERNQSFPWSNILLNPNSTPNSINIPSGFQPPSQYWSQSSYHNEGKNVISLPTTVTTTVDSFQSLDCLCDDNMSIVFPDYDTFRDKNGNNNINLSGTSVSATVSSDNSVTKDDSVTKEIDDATNTFQPNNSFEFYQAIDHNSSRSHRPRSDPVRSVRPVQSGRLNSSTINFRREAESGETETETDNELVVQMKEMIYRAAVFRPVSFDDGEAVERPRRRNVRISSEPQTVAARRRRERISERIRVLQKLVPGGNKMDTASMLDEAASYLRFLKSQVEAFERLGYGGCGTRDDADGTSCNAMNVDCDVAVGVPLTSQSRFLQGHERVWRNSGYQ